MSSSNVRTPLTIVFSVWHAIFLREAVDRLFGMRAAWLWLLFEPVFHILFIALVWSALRAHSVGGIDFFLWISVGMLSFFLFRRTSIQVMYAADCNRALFAYRQVKPFDAAIVRAGLEAFLMSLITAVILSIAALIGHAKLPEDIVLAMTGAVGLWLLGLGYGLVASVLMRLVPELEHILMVVMLPMYLISGVIMPISSVPMPYRTLLLINPVAHGLDAVRLGFVPAYHAVPGMSLGYLYGFGIVSIFIGLLLYRRFGVKLVTQ